LSVTLGNCLIRGRPSLFRMPLFQMLLFRISWLVKCHVFRGLHPDMLLHLGVSSKHLICSKDMYNFWKK